MSFITIKNYKLVALKAAYDEGMASRAEGGEISQNPYAHTIRLDGHEEYCPSAEQRDAWGFGFSGEWKSFVDFTEQLQKEAEAEEAARIGARGHDCFEDVRHDDSGGRDAYYCASCGELLQVG